jgi:hypothetical protein
LSALSNFGDQIRGQVLTGVGIVRSRLFGANNERLDFLMDSFYKLSAPQQSAVFAGLVGIVTLFVLSALVLYFSQVAGLNRELSMSLAARHELEALRGDFARENQRFEKLTEQLKNRTRDLRMKPFFEKIGNDQGVQIEGLTEQRVPLPDDNALARAEFQAVKVDLRVNNISIPKMLNFMMEIEKANNFIRIRDLQIRGRFGTRLYFDGTITARGYASR